MIVFYGLGIKFFLEEKVGTLSDFLFLSTVCSVANKKQNGIWTLSVLCVAGGSMAFTEYDAEVVLKIEMNKTTVPDWNCVWAIRYLAWC